MADAIAKSGIGNVFLDNTTDTFELVNHAELILTVNSSVGLEAMFFEKPVVACGDCFWAIDGIATSARTPQDIALTLARPDAVKFDTQTRGAFLNYLDQMYYPSLSQPQKAAIETRLAGRDVEGFWDAHAK